MMNFLYEWIKQIMIVIILGSILELLLPNSEMKKYVHLVFGLLLFIVIVQPLFSLFQINIFSEIERIEQQYFSDSSEQQTNYSIEKQKKEIETKQAAYIWNELRETMIEQANPVLEETYQFTITDLQFEATEDSTLLINDTEPLTIHVSVSNVNDAYQSPQAIKEITITEENENRAVISSQTENKLEQLLRQIWGLTESEKLILKLEGGTS